MYKAIFLDIDDTVFNFKKCSESALEQTFSALKLNYEESIFDAFTEIDEGLWLKQKRNQLTVAEVLDMRFVHLKEKLEIDYDSAQVQTQFGSLLGEQYIMEQGIEKVLEKLSPVYSIYAASNGMLTIQKNRLELSGLREHFTDLFVSDDIGYAKPDSCYFKECLNRTDLKTTEILMVGDSLTSDIAGANVAGIDSCWYNPCVLENDSEAEADFEIHHLNDLTCILDV